jgi:hypothetical protein
MAIFTTDRRPKPIYWFTVTGRGLFPIDMLRYDMAWPATDEDAVKIVGADFGYDGDGAPRHPRSIRLGCAQTHGPTDGRWASFGWTLGDASKGEVA